MMTDCIDIKILLIVKGKYDIVRFIDIKNLLIVKEKVKSQFVYSCFIDIRILLIVKVSR